MIFCEVRSILSWILMNNMFWELLYFYCLDVLLRKGFVLNSNVKCIEILKCWFGLVMSSVNEVKPFVGLFTRIPYLFSHCSPNTYLKQHANWHFYQCHTDDKYNIIISVVLVVVSVVKWYKSRSNSIFFDTNNCLNTMLLTNYILYG